jgi:hypothetical protein
MPLEKYLSALPPISSWHYLRVCFLRFLRFDSLHRLSFIAAAGCIAPSKLFFYPLLRTNQTSKTLQQPATFTMAFEWLAPILTPTALRSVQADGRPVITLFLVIFGLSLFGLLCWYIHFETSKAYPKKVDPNAKKPTGIKRFIKF